MTLQEDDTRRVRLLSLMDPFAPEEVGKLPRITCGACSSDRRKFCDDHKKERCNTCNSSITTKHIHLDYVGHADVTRRLLSVDPEWTWEPAAEDDQGLPVLDTDDRGNPVGMWIKLTVLGVTRRGYGSCPSNQGDAVKVLIGDALRNAAMRFGVAVDLWAKGDRADPSTENAVAAPGRRAQPQRREAQQARSQVDAGASAQVLGEYQGMIAAATTADEVRALMKRGIDDFKVGRLDNAAANQVQQACKQRLDRLANQTATGLPANKDGSVSRSKLTDEEKAANGLMTDSQVREHNKLARDTVANPRAAERMATTPPDDPWVNGSGS
jgi:hypothetical protein